VVDFLIKNSANVGLPNSVGTTPVLAAARAGHSAAVKLLVANGADAPAETELDSVSWFEQVARIYPTNAKLLPSLALQIRQLLTPPITTAHIAGRTFNGAERVGVVI
jgi:ankyrin repeat protein